MRTLRYTLRCDGPSDRALLPIINWTLRANGFAGALAPAWADLRHLANPPKRLSDQLQWAMELYPCDVLFIHRDAEKESPATRRAEIQTALTALPSTIAIPHVYIIPVRMTEAWLLFDEAAIRHAAGNPHGSQPLSLPALQRIEKLPDPKHDLHQLLRLASGVAGRRLEKLNLPHSVYRIADLIDDFTPLRTLPAFQQLEEDLKSFLASWA